eukprot:2108920-Pleurochrysis_carterae.AAC.1
MKRTGRGGLRPRLGARVASAPSPRRHQGVRGERGGRRWPLARHPDQISRERRKSARPGASGPVRVLYDSTAYGSSA